VKVRPELPTGTVTFLFSDIEGSTRLLQALGERYPAVLETHQDLLRQAFGAHGGRVVGTEGDSFFVVFPDAPAALAGAVASQRALADHPWPDGARIKVRMGLHTGQGTLGGANYVGLDVHRAARIAAAGRGGQLLVSATTRGLIEDTLPEHVTLRDLGDHGLRDLELPERLYQVVIPGLPADFPPIRSAEPRQGNLPTPLTSFVGRERALREVKDLVSRAKLVTLTGPGGTGKTSLALRAAADLQAEMEDGAFLIRLGSISDPDLVIPTIATAFGIAEQAERPPLELLIEHLRAKNVLLVLDNFEQIMAATEAVGELLGQTPRVRTLVTSREALGLQGEQQYPVPPLETPDLANLPALDRLARYEAVSLFVARASAVRQGFTLTTENAAAIAEICARLDGLPLAIELAAATTKVLSPQALLARLVQRLPLLGGASRDVPARQRTLRDTIAWSYDMLPERQRELFARLSVFAGGFTLAAAESICADALGDTFEGVASLVNKSLLRQVETTAEDPRFAMLGTIREFAADQLAAAGQEEALERLHAQHFLALTEQAEPELTGSRSAGLLDALAADDDNLRAALDRAMARGWLDVALRLGAALWRYWQMRGHLREGSERLGRLLAMPGVEAHPAAHIAALGAAGSVAYWMGHLPAAQRAYERAVALSREDGDPRTVAECLYNLAFTIHFQGVEEDASAGLPLLKEAASLFQQAGDRGGRAKTLWALAGMIEADDAAAMAMSLEALGIFQELGDRFYEGWALRGVAIRARRLGLIDESRARLAEGLEIFREAGDLSAKVMFLGSFADLAAFEGDVERALRLAGAAAASSEATDAGLADWIGSIDERQRLVEQIATDADAARLWAEGQAMSIDEAVAYALTPPAAQPVESSPFPAGQGRRALIPGSRVGGGALTNVD
jgi:predicted ATPase/class 3 adenylate cyclase